MSPESPLDHIPGWEHMNDAVRLFPRDKRDSSTSSSSCTLRDENHCAHTQPAVHGASADADRESLGRSNGEDDGRQTVEVKHPNAVPEGRYYQCLNFRWWLSAHGINENIIKADVRLYLGPEAELRFGYDRYGEAGYWISAYRTFTPAMVQDLKTDSNKYAQIIAGSGSLEGDAFFGQSLALLDWRIDRAANPIQEEENAERSNEADEADDDTQC